MSSGLMNGAEVFVSKTMLLLAPLSAWVLSRCSSLLTMRLATHDKLSDWLLGELFMLS
jgi:hypothetical protein